MPCRPLTPHWTSSMQDSQTVGTCLAAECKRIRTKKTVDGNSWEYNPVATEAPDDRITSGSFVSAAPVKNSRVWKRVPFPTTTINEKTSKSNFNSETTRNSNSKQTINEQDLCRFWTTFVPFCARKQSLADPCIHVWYADESRDDWNRVGSIWYADKSRSYLKTFCEDLMNFKNCEMIEARTRFQAVDFWRSLDRLWQCLGEKVGAVGLLTGWKSLNMKRNSYSRRRSLRKRSGMRSRKAKVYVISFGRTWAIRSDAWEW